jgi:hypothetical protein
MTIHAKTFTLKPAGVDGSAVATKQWSPGRPGFVRALKVDYQNQPVTTALTIQANNDEGDTLFDNGGDNTNIPLTPVGMPGIDEGAAALAATDASSGGWPFTSGLYIDISAADGQTSGDEAVVITVMYEV